MSAWGEGFAIFKAAIRSILDRPRAAIPLFLLVGVGFTATDLIWVYSVYNDPYSDPGFLGTFVDVMLVAVLAVGWHRAVLRPDASGLSGLRWLRYGLAWFINGIAFFILMIPLFVLIIIVLGAGSDWLLYGQVYLGEGLLPAFSAWSLSLLVLDPVGTVLAILIGGPVFLYLLYRMALGLPKIAIDEGDLRFAKSWRRSAPLARPIAALALIAGVAQFGPLMLPYLYLSFAPSPPTTFAEEVPFSVFGSALYTMTVLVGAAILTELYRRTEP